MRRRRISTSSSYMPAAGVQAIERGQRVGVLLVDLEDAQVAVDGGWAGRAARRRTRGPGAGGCGAARRPPAWRSSTRMYALDQIDPAGGVAGQALDLLDGQGRARLLAQRLAPPDEGARLIEQLVLGQLGQALDHRHPVARVGQLAQLHLVDLVQLLELAGGQVQRLEHRRDLHLVVPLEEQHLERGDGRAVVRVGRQDLAVDLDRGRHVAQVLLQGLAEPELQRDRLLVAVGQLDLLAQRVGQLLPAAGRACTAGRGPAPRRGCRTRRRGCGGRCRSPRRSGRAPPRRRGPGATADRPGAARRATCPPRRRRAGPARATGGSGRPVAPGVRG